MGFVDDLLGRIKKLFAFVGDSMRKSPGTQKSSYGSLRMCPFCGRITARSKRSCLECVENHSKPFSLNKRTRSRGDRPRGILIVWKVLDVLVVLN